MQTIRNYSCMLPKILQRSGIIYSTAYIWAFFFIFSKYENKAKQTKSSENSLKWNSGISAVCTEPLVALNRGRILLGQMRQWQLL